MPDLTMVDCYAHGLISAADLYATTGQHETEDYLRTWTSYARLTTDEVVRTDVHITVKRMPESTTGVHVLNLE